MNLVQSRNLSGPPGEQANKAVYLAKWTRSPKRNGPVRLLLQLDFLSWPDTQMLQDIFAESNLARFGDGQSLRSLTSLSGSNSNAKKALHVIEVEQKRLTLCQAGVPASV